MEGTEIPTEKCLNKFRLRIFDRNVSLKPRCACPFLMGWAGSFIFGKLICLLDTVYKIVENRDTADRLG